MSLLKNEYNGVNFIVADYGQSPIEDYDGIKVIKSLKFSENKLIGFFKLISALNKSNSDIFIQRSLDAASGIIALYCKLKKKKFIYMVAADSETDRGYEQNHNFIINQITFWGFKLADKIIVQNEYQKSQLKKYYNADGFLLKNSDHINTSKPFEKKTILWVGKSEILKRPELVLKLAQEFSAFKFVMIFVLTPGRDKYMQEIKQQAIKISNIQFIEFVPITEIDSFYKEALIHINTSTKEGFPNTFIHAAKYKTPIVSLIVNPDNFISNTKCGFACDNDFELMKNSISSLLSNKLLYDEMAENAYQYVLKNHNIQENSAKFAEIINSL